MVLTQTVFCDVLPEWQVRVYLLQVVADCGTNFIGAARELKELMDKLKIHQIQQSTVDNGVN